MKNELKLIIELAEELNNLLLGHMSSKTDFEFLNPIDTEVKELLNQKAQKILKTIICAKG